MKILLIALALVTSGTILHASEKPTVTGTFSAFSCQQTQKGTFSSFDFKPSQRRAPVQPQPTLRQAPTAPQPALGPCLCATASAVASTAICCCCNSIPESPVIPWCIVSYAALFDECKKFTGNAQIPPTFFPPRVCSQKKCTELDYNKELARAWAAASRLELLNMKRD